MKIRFASANAACVYSSMAEGMSEVSLDSLMLSRAVKLDIVSELCAPNGHGTYPRDIELLDDLRGVAIDVLENCIDNASGSSLDDEDYLHPGDVEIDPAALN